MNLKKLFETQKILRDRINYNESDRFEKLILALLVELGECANEWRGFKFWSKNQEPRIEAIRICRTCGGSGTPIGIPIESGVDCWNCNDSSGEIVYNPLLEEYVDGLHFVLDLGLEININPRDYAVMQEENVTNQFRAIYYWVSKFSMSKIRTDYLKVVRWYLGLGEMLGFTWEQIEQAYFDKNAINHQRQEDGY